MFRTAQKRVWNRSVQKSSTHRNTSFHFDTVRRCRRGAGGRPTLPRWPGAARRAARATDGIKSSCQISKKNKHAHDVPPLSHSTHTAARVPRTWQRAHAWLHACMAEHMARPKRGYTSHTEACVSRAAHVTTSVWNTSEHFGTRPEHFDMVASAPAGSAVQK